MKEFKDKIAVVTGGASGIGKALARALLSEGAIVIIADVEQGALDKALAELGGKVSGVVTDVSSADSLGCVDQKRISLVAGFGFSHFVPLTIIARSMAIYDASDLQLLTELLDKVLIGIGVWPPKFVVEMGDG